MQIYAIDISDKIVQPISQKLQQVSLNSRLQIIKYKKREDAVRKLYGELMLRRIVKEQLSLNDDEIHIDKNSYGKPFLRGILNFHYNISHSGDWVVCAICDSPIGIDIEHITEGSLEIAQRFFTREETAYLLVQPPERQADCFFELWTLKESYIKQIGMGFSINLKDFSIIKIDNEWRGVSVKYNDKLFFHQYDFHAEYKLSICSEKNHFPQSIIYFNDV